MIKHVKYFCFILFLLQTSSLQAQEHPRNDSIQIIGPLLQKLRSNTITIAEKKVLRQLAFDIQNNGQSMDELGHNYKESLILIDSALMIFNALKDTFSVANNKKFKGYLLGRLQRFEEGKSEIHQAIELYHLKNADWGVAVSQFDMARLYDFEHKTDSAIFYCNTALSYWQSQKNNDRIFLNRNLLIHLLTKANKLAEAQSLQQQSEKMTSDNTFHWLGLIDFYVVSEKLFNKINESTIAARYHELYTNKITELEKEGITGRSYFDQ